MFESSEGPPKIKNRVAAGTPEICERSELRAMSNAELAHLWVSLLKAKRSTEAVLREFRIREWERQEENSLIPGRPLELGYPPMRTIEPWERETCGVSPFA